jgi:hypothetical protein
METAPLKSFATWARTTLIREVAARVTVVLAPASPERIEQPKAVDALEKAVNAAGDGDKGRTAVADRVAYTWFNRLIALRFMDANGYTGTAVVSPQVGVEGGQPEILAEAKRGNIDAAIVGTKTREAVTGLLNGTRNSEDPQGEAYALLLADYCRHWNRAMPFMFEREGDFTELLIPANLLADDSVLNRAVKVLTADVCQDVEVIGWLYQFYISERHDEVFADFKKNKKAGADEIPAATQLFTPHWIVRYLVENSLGRLWLLNRPSSRLVDQMEYYITPVDEETDFLKVSSPEELKVIDPACGSGHMLTYAFDLLYAIYEEAGYAPSEIPAAILTNNLYGVEIDPRAGSLAALALTMKARARQRTFFNKRVVPNVCVLEPIRFTPQELDFLLTSVGDRDDELAFWTQFEKADTLGALVRPPLSVSERLREHFASSVEAGDLISAEVRERAAKVLGNSAVISGDYHVVVANPPYMGARNMGSVLAEWIKENYPTAKQDLYGAFVLRNLLLLKPNGLLAMIIGDTWMSIKMFEEFRSELLERWTFLSLLHLRDSAYHADVFGANAAFVLSVKHFPEGPCTFMRLEPLDLKGKEHRAIQGIRHPGSPWMYIVSTADFSRIPGSPFAYWADSSFLQAFEGPSLGRFIITEGQNKTGDNDRYLRFHWEVSQVDGIERRRWIPYAKGGKFRKWYGNVEYVVDWSDAARAEYRRNPSCRIVAEKFWYREGITWTDVSAKGTGFRYLPPGGTFDMAGPTAFLSSDADIYGVLGALNSTFTERALQAINPTIHVQLKDVRSLPFPESVAKSSELSDLARTCVDISRDDWDQLETSIDFARPAPVELFSKGQTLRAVIEECVAWQRTTVAQLKDLEFKIDTLITDLSIQRTFEPSDSPEPVTLWANPDYRYERRFEEGERDRLRARDCVLDLVSYAVGCMFGRYSFNEPGLILADQGATLQEYLAKVPTPTFMPDADNVIPVVDGDWFEDDIVAQFRRFLRAAFGEEHFEENLYFVTESLGVKDLRDYFVKSFYENHVKRYKKRPIYWLFSSPNGSFNALIYMHRYTPSTASTVLNEYLREYKAKLESSLQHHERLAAGGGAARLQAAVQKEADRLRKVLLELDKYEHDILYPLASRQVSIDLDDGVKVNYSKLGAALKKIPGLEASDE